MTQPKVSFLIPVYNGMPFLPEAVESVLAQTDGDWDLILVDDGSSDESAAFIRALTDPRIKTVFNQVNLGLYGSLAQAVRSMNADWVSILMQDDRLKPNYLQEMRRLLASYPQGAAFWATEDTIDGKGELLIAGSTTGREEVIQPGVGPWLGALRRGCIWTISGSFTRRDLFLVEAFRKELPHCGDYDWLLRALWRWQFVYYEFSVAQLRRHEGQASASNLAIGKDVEEQYAIIRRHYRKHANDLGFRSAFGIALSRSRLTFTSLLGALRHGNFRKARLMMTYVLRYLGLPLHWWSAPK
jgi:glycosyltransferase involved in cell wall biosynthesis